MDSNLIITGPLAKYHIEYQDKEKFLAPQSEIPPLQTNESSPKIFSRVKGLSGSFASGNRRDPTVLTRRARSVSGIAKPLVPMRRGDVIFIAPISNDEGSALCFMSTTVATSRTCVNFWKNEDSKSNPYAGYYKINPANRDDKPDGHIGSSAKYNNKENDTIKQGEAVTFQLLLSQTYLSADIGVYADIEKNFFQLGLSNKQDDLCTLFSIRTRYNWRMGASVYYDDQVYITHELSQLELHQGDRTANFGSSFYGYGVHRRVEVNLAQLMESSNCAQFYWVINKFCSEREGGGGGDNNDRISVGSCVSVHCPHADAYLWGSLNSRVFDKFGPKAREDTINQGNFFNKPPSFVLGEQKNVLKVGFRVEGVHSMRGGAVSRTGLYRLRHLGSNTYLCVERDQDSGALSTVLCRLRRGATSKERISFLFSTLFQFHALMSVDEERDGSYLTSRSSFLHIVHPTITMPAASTSLMYDDIVEQLLAGNFTVSASAAVALTPGPRRGRKQRAYMYLPAGDKRVFHIPPQESMEYGCAHDEHKAAVQLSGFPEDYDALVLHKISAHMVEAYTKVLDEHVMFDSWEADLYQYALLPEAKRAQSPPCRADTIFEIRTMLSSLVSIEEVQHTAIHMSVFQIFDKQDLVSAIQWFSCSARIVDRVLWLLAFPHTLRMTWLQLCHHSDGMADIFVKAQKAVLVIGKENSHVQEYIARGKVKGYRTLCLDISQEAFASPESVAALQEGYFSTFARWLPVNEAREISCRMLQELLFKNSRLSQHFACEPFMQEVVSLIKRCGPSPSLLQLLASIVSITGGKNSMTGESVLRVLCSTLDDPFYLDNRVMTLIETVQHPHSAKGGALYIAWNGSSFYRSDGVDVDHFYFDPSTLGLCSVAIPPPSELVHYSMRRDVPPSHLQGVLLEDVAWHIDPVLYFRSWDETAPIDAWNREIGKHLENPNFATENCRLKDLAGHYLAVINLYKELCKESVPGQQFLERQFSYEMIRSALSNSKIPLVFKRAFVELMNNLYIQRYPYIKQVFPNCVRTRPDFDDAQGLDGALNSGRIDRNQCVCDSADTSSMQAEISFMEKNESHTMSYRKYLQAFKPDTVSAAGDKHKDLQDLLFYHFSVLMKTAPYARLRQAGGGRGGVEVLQFECTALDLVASLLCRGFYSSMKRLGEALKISLIVCQTINKSAASTKISQQDPSVHIKTANLSNVYSLLDDDDNGDDGDDNGDLSDEDDVYDDDSDVEHKDRGSSVTAYDLKTMAEMKDATGLTESLAVAGTSSDTGTRRELLLREDESAANLGILVDRLCKQHDTQQFSTTVTETVFENQRWSGVKYFPISAMHPIGPFSSENPVLARIFSSQHPINCHVDDPAGLEDPDVWVWQGDWQVQVVQTLRRKGEADITSRAIDDEGWFYAFDWQAEFHPEAKNLFSYVRRRKWERCRRHMTAREFFERMTKMGFSKEALHDACLAGECINSSGRINFKKVLAVLTSPEELNISSPSNGVKDKTCPIALIAAVDKNRQSSGGADAQQLWLQTMAKSCNIMNISYDVILNARMTIFFKNLVDAAPPSSLKRTGDSGAEPMWCLGTNGAPMLTSRGSRVMRDLFRDLSCTGLMFDHATSSSDEFTAHLAKMVMEDHHDLCGSALTVLRREFNQVSDFKDLIKKTMIITDCGDCKQYKLISVSLNCLEADANVYLALNLSRKQKNLGVVSNITKLVAGLDKTLALSASDSTNSSHACFQIAICARQEYVSLINILLKSLTTLERVSFCGPICGMLRHISSFLCHLCQDNTTNKKRFFSFAPQLLQVFNSGSSDRGCSCVHNSCIKVISTIFHEVDFDARHFSLAFIPKLLAYMDPDYLSPSALMHVTSLVKDIVYPNRKLIVAPVQPVVLKGLLRVTRNKAMFFDDSAYVSRSQVNNRLAYIKEYTQSHDLNFTVASIKDSEPQSLVTLLFHTECVEMLALCCDEVCNHIDPKLSSLLTVNTLLAVMTDKEAGSVRCPPLMYSYGLFLYHVYLKNSDNGANMTHSSLISFFTSDLMWRLVDNYCAIAAADTSLSNAYRPFIFDIAIPSVEVVLKMLSAGQRPPSYDVATANTTAREVRKTMQSLLQNFIKDPIISAKERRVVEDACLYFNVPIDTDEVNGLENVLESNKPTTQVDITNVEYDFLGIHDDDDDVASEESKLAFEMTDTTIQDNVRMTGPELCGHATRLMENCPDIEQLRKETGTENLITKLMKMDMMCESARGGVESAASSVTSESTEEPSSSGGTTSSSSSSSGAFVSALIKRLAVYVKKVITSIRSKNCPSSHDAVQNVKLVFDIFTTALSSARKKDSQSTELADLQLLMCNYQAGHLVVEIVSLAHSGGDASALLDCALTFGYEFLFNGNRKCQQSMLDFMLMDNSARLSNFFKSLALSIKNYSEIMKSMIHARNGIKEVDVTVGFVSKATCARHYVTIMSRAKATFLLLQLLCEGHYLDMQQVFDNEEKGYHVLSSTALFCDQVFPANIDISHLLRCELFVVYAAFDALIEAVQGPCFKNQEVLLGNERFISTLARWSSSKVSIGPDSFSLYSGSKIHFDLRQNDPKFYEPVDFFTLKLLRNKCLILRTSMLEGRALRDDCGCVKAMYDKLRQGEDSRRQLMTIHSEYRSAKKYGRQIMLNPQFGRVVYRLIRSEAHLLLTYFTAMKRWFPRVMDDVTPSGTEVVRRKRMSSDAEHAAAVRKCKKLGKYKRVYSSYMDRQRNIEVLWADKGLFQISFQKPRECEFMTEDIKTRVKRLIIHDNDDKVAQFLASFHIVESEMKLQMHLRDNNLHFILFFQDEISLAMICLSFAINFVVAISLEKGYFSGSDRPQYSSPVFSRLVMAFQVVQVCGYVVALLQALVLVMPVARHEWFELSKRLCAASSQEQFSHLEKMLRTAKHFVVFFIVLITVVIMNVLLSFRYERTLSTVWSLSCLLLAKVFFESFMAATREPFLAGRRVVGWAVIGLNIATAPSTLIMSFFTIVSFFCLDPDKPYFNAIMLLAIAFKSSTLQNVIKSVTIPFTSLALSSLLGVICIFIFTIFGFYFLPNDFYNEDQSIDECSTVMMCFVTFLHGGFLSGGGIADHLNDLGHEPALADSRAFPLRVAYDIAFFVMIIILLLNIIFGIIIDTFGSLREEQHEQHRLQTSYCFICGIAKDEFDARALNATVTGERQLDFTGHVKQEHNMWDYLFYRIYLSLKDPNNYNGVESFIAGLCADDDISWVPRGRTLGINDAPESSTRSDFSVLTSELNELADSLLKAVRCSADTTAKTVRAESVLARETVDALRGDVEALRDRVEELAVSAAAAASSTADAVRDK